MLKKIKHYEMADNLDVKKLEKLGFISAEDNKYSKCINLYDDIEVFIRFNINEDGTLSFDDYDDVDVIDDNYMQYYTPFYESKKPFHFLDLIVFKYNEVMDNLVLNEILKPKEQEEYLEEPMKRTLKKQD